MTERGGSTADISASGAVEADLSQALAEMDRNPRRALALAQRAADTSPNNASAYRLIAAALRRLGQMEGANDAELTAIRASIHDPVLQEAAEALAANALHAAEPILRARLKAIPTDVAAIRMFAELAGRIGRYRDAENLLRRALELAPGFHPARSNLATVLHRQHRTEDALEQLDLLAQHDPDNVSHSNLRAAALGRIGAFDEAIALYEAVLTQLPDQPKIWMSYGHALKTVGRQDDAVAAYRRAVAIRPALGEAWWSLANLKTVRFDEDDVAGMEKAVDGANLSDDDRLHLDFALGKALDDAGDVDRAFDHYAAANALRKRQLAYSADDISRQVDRTIALFTPEFLAARAGQGCVDPDPIFILGMPRAGSTLIEQILACHSQVEGTMELPDIPALAARREKGQDAAYPDWLATADAGELEALGRDYLDRTRIQRKEGKAFFIDKLPNNWLHTGFIHLILPNATIIDARRHPMDCGFSNFRQHFARGQSFSYDLEDIGRYYADYVRLMAHFDRVVPGRVNRVIHERLLDEPETEIATLLNALDLPFEEACLSFHESKRAVRTASSEQVRRPINREGVDRWQAYGARLAPLRHALGGLADSYPAIPDM